MEAAIVSHKFAVITTTHVLIIMLRVDIFEKKTSTKET